MKRTRILLALFLIISFKLSYSQTHKYLAPEGGETKINFVGNGDIQKTISENSGIQANTGLGINFFRLWNGRNDKTRGLIKNIELDFVINVASTADTITSRLENGVIANRRDFGSFILNPVNSKQATFLNFNAYTNNDRDWGKGKLNFFRNILSGFNFRFIASNAIWTNTSSVHLSGFLMRAGIFHDFVPDDNRLLDDYSVTVGVNYSYRGVLGDIRFKENEQFRHTLLSSSRVKYHGIEFNAGLRFKNIRAEVQVPMFKYADTEVVGLTNTQFVTSIRFIGGFPLSLSGSNKTKDLDESRVTKL